MYRTASEHVGPRKVSFIERVSSIYVGSSLYSDFILVKATPDVRTPLYKGHFTESQMHSFSYKSTPEIRPPLYKGQNFIHYKGTHPT